jgi:hydroxyacylglutathione hydrolase
MFEVGSLSTDCYVVHCKDTLQAIVIDPGFTEKTEANEIITYITNNKLIPKFIVNTHGHPDHNCGNIVLKSIFHVPICIHKADAYMLGESGIETRQYFGYSCPSPSADVLLCEGNKIVFGNVFLTVLETPGHSEGGIVLLGDAEVFTGDTLFAGSMGRTDFPGSSASKMEKSLRRLQKLPDNFTVYPGHGPVSTIGEEKRGNPFLRAF